MNHDERSPTDERLPWHPSELVEVIDNLVNAIPRKNTLPSSAIDALFDDATFHLDFLHHHLSNPLFPGPESAAAFCQDSLKKYYGKFVASARNESPKLSFTTSDGPVGLATVDIHGSGGKPVMSQSALHGFHVFEGLQLHWRHDEQSNSLQFGYAFREAKVAKLIDGIIRLRFAVHLLKAATAIAHLRHIEHHSAAKLSARYKHLARSALPQRRIEAERQTNVALDQFILANINELTTSAQQPDTGRFVYVRAEAQGGDRESIGQGPIGVGQSTLQVLGQHAKPESRPARLVINAAGPPRMHTLVGPYSGSAMNELLGNRSAHHGNMGHQHLSSEMALPHGSDMLMRTCELDASGHVQGPFVAETNFSNVVFVYGDMVLFPRSSSATYGLIQHELRSLLRHSLASSDGPSAVKDIRHEPLRFDTMLADLRDGRITAACVLGSMPAVRAVDGIVVDGSLEGGPISTHRLESDGEVVRQITKQFQHHLQKSIAWRNANLDAVVMHH